MDICIVKSKKLLLIYTKRPFGVDRFRRLYYNLLYKSFYKRRIKMKAGFARVDITPPLGAPVDGYFRDKCVFSEEIDIEDTMSVNVKYNKGTVMSYSLTAHS